MNRTEELSTVVNQLKKYMRSLIIDDILSGGGSVSTEYYPGSFIERQDQSTCKVSGVATYGSSYKVGVTRTITHQRTLIHTDHEDNHPHTLEKKINRRGNTFDLLCLTQLTKDSHIQATHTCSTFHSAFIFKGLLTYRFCVIKCIRNLNDILYLNRIKITLFTLSQTL